MKVIVTHHVDGYYNIYTIIDGLVADGDENTVSHLDDKDLQVILARNNLVKYDRFQDYYERHFPLTGYYSDEGIPPSADMLRPLKPTMAEMRKAKAAMKPAPLDYQEIAKQRMRAVNMEGGSIIELNKRRDSKYTNN